MRDVIIRDAAPQCLAYRKQVRDGIVEWVGKVGTRSLIDRLGPRVCPLDLEAVAQVLLNQDVEGVVLVIVAPIGVVNAPEVGIQNILGAGGEQTDSTGISHSVWTAGIEKARRRYDRGLAGIHVVRAKLHVNAVITDIRHRRRQIGRQLALHAQIPLLDVIAMRVGFHIADAQRARIGGFGHGEDGECTLGQVINVPLRRKRS